VINRLTVRQARTTMSTILKSGKTVAIGSQYGHLRGFIVGMPEHNTWNREERGIALKAAKAQFTKAWIAESQQ
jgi:hypothetical protein